MNVCLEHSCLCYRCNSFIVDLRHKFTIRNMNEIHVFVQSSEISNIRNQLRESTMKEFHLYVRSMSRKQTKVETGVCR